MMQDSSSPKNMTGLLTSLQQKKDQDSAALVELTSGALANLDSHLQRQSLDVLHSTSSVMVQASEQMASSVVTSLETTQSNIIESLSKMETRHEAAAIILEERMAEAHNHLKDGIVFQTNSIANQMRQVHETVQLPVTELTAAVQKATETFERADQLMKLAKWAALGAVIVCLMVCLGIWLYWETAAPWSLEKIGTQEYQVLGGDWTRTCPWEGRQAPCKLVK